MLLKLVDRFIAHIDIERGLSPATVAAYRSDLELYCNWLQRHGIDEPSAIRRDDVESFVADLADDGQSSGSRSRRLAAVHMFHRFLVGEGLAADDPSAQVRAPKSAERLPEALTVDEVTRLLDAVRPVSGQPVEYRDAAMLELLYATGARVSELCALNLDDIDFDERVVRLTGKGAKQRLVPFGQYAAAALGEYLDHGRPSLEANVNRKTASPERRAVFLNKRGRRISRQSVWEVLSNAGQKAHLTSPLHPHTLRHTFATHLIQGGADVRSVQELLGHASVRTTQVYTHVSPETLKETYLLSHPRAR
ncbi:site-specific tyrosine recombinase XerD [Bifidobacterium choloepi]|uniref:Tyrosine recombinase XerD n=1 Tax=Bifidobacterium choloepi TaxID=2614131 RepID=A0A6I5MZK6_9BIFI|nr:site-specific tyrosine recombinase XerD [Bifidobacterium choloepi]NEG70088.1 site-specific tyrosine recombinase XerD [Bifidobacterium choloepi]